MPGAFACAGTHLVGVETVVPDHLDTLVGNVLRQNGEEVDGVEDLKVAIDLRIDLGTVDDGVDRGFQRYFLHREGIAEDVLAKLLAFGAVLRRDGAVGVHVESGVFPGFHPGHQFRRDEFVAEQFGEDLGAKEFFQNPMRDFRGRMPGSGFVQEAVRHQCVDVGMEVEVLAESVKR